MDEHAERFSSEVLATEELTRRIIENVPAGIVQVGLDGSVLRANALAQRFLGLSYDQLTRRYISDFAPQTILEDGSPCPVDAYPVAACLMTGVAQPAKVIGVQRPDGTVFWGVFTAVPFHPPGQPMQGVVVTFLDITERKKLEAQVIRAQRLDSLGVMAGGIAHDFNNLLMAILAHANLAISDVTPGPLQDHLRNIETAAQRASELVQQLLVYAGRRPLRAQPVELPALVQEMASLLQASISRRARLRCELSPDTPAVSGDGTQLRQVVMNLIINASDALGESDGDITIRSGRCTPAADERARMLLPPGAEATYALLEIADSGCGMDAGTLARVFEPFFTTKFTGRGLGLPAVLGIIKGHRGGIDVRSTLGQGTVFRILLPALAAPALPVPVERAAPVTLPAPATVLVVDDEPAVRNVVRMMLERRGFTVVTAADGLEAVEAVAREGARLRAVFLDVTMPRLDGREALRRIRVDQPALPVVLASGNHDAVDDVTGPTVFLRKPFRPDELLRALAHLLPSG